jgi:fructose-bisphosphate aldolase / 2-amino-3,7-dideoxy-D-threo-hept-6-ulosonate synthase
VVTGKAVRMQRLWKHRRAVLVPYDHGSFGGPQNGIEDLVQLTERVARTNADGILVSAGILPHIAPAVGQLGIMARVDGGFTRYAKTMTDYQQFLSIRDAVTLGADAAIVFTLVGTSVEAASLKRLGETAAEAHAWGMPLAAEIIPPSLLNNHFGMEIFPKSAADVDVNEETAQIIRIGAEAGADIIKTRFSGNAEQFRRAVKSCPAKVIVAGGPLSSKSDEAVLELAAQCVRAEADGIIFGRNVWQHPRMEKMIAALCAIVHEEESVTSAAKLLR